MMIIRDADSRDAALISHIHCTSWRKAYQGLVPQHYLDRLPDEHWIPSVRAWLDSGRFQCLMVYEDKKPLGVCIFGRGRDEDHADWGEIVSLYLLPEATRQGYGSAVLRASLARMREDGFSRFYVWTLEGNLPADRFYRREGFYPTSDQDTFPLGGESIRERRYVRVE